MGSFGPMMVLGWQRLVMRRDEITIRQMTRARLLRAKRCLTANYCYCDVAARAVLILSMK